MTGNQLRIGLISDTHGLLRPEAVGFLQGCDRIVHAGDIGSPEILSALAAVAPITAVKGNNDRGDWADSMPDIARVSCGHVTVLVIHDLADLPIDSISADVQVVVSGHSHRPTQAEHDGLLFVNPGSAGRRRFRLPVSIGELWISLDSVSARLVELDCS